VTEKTQKLIWAINSFVDAKINLAMKSNDDLYPGIYWNRKQDENLVEQTFEDMAKAIEDLQVDSQNYKEIM
jgi:hypothetical protein